MLHENEPAPDFSLPDQDGTIVSLGDFKGRWLLLYFYPKDDTPGCTTESCGFRDIKTDLENKNCAILGVSANTVYSHKKFAEKYHLNFPILSDENKEMVTAYDVWKKKTFVGREYMGIVRTSFLIDPHGKIAKIYEGVKPEEHPTQVLGDIDSFQQSA